jgi:hypothetical protein
VPGCCIHIRPYQWKLLFVFADDSNYYFSHMDTNFNL